MLQLVQFVDDPAQVLHLESHLEQYKLLMYSPYLQEHTHIIEVER